MPTDSPSAVALAELLKEVASHFQNLPSAYAKQQAEASLQRLKAALSADRPAPPATNTVQCGAHPYRSGVGSDKCLDCGGIGFDSHWGHTRLTAPPAPQDREAPR